MSALGEPGRGGVDDEWIAVDEAAAVGTARRRAAKLARTVGLDEDRVGHVEIVASELASNLIKHARGGDLILRLLPCRGLRLITVDTGPGTRDLEALIGDGLSTAGTLGVGLGAVRRLTTRLELWSAPGRGAIVVADIVAGAGVPASDQEPRERVGSLLRPLRGETVCGDTIACRRTPSGWLLMLADGLGHGILAAEASRRAAQVLATWPSDSPGELVGRMHQALGGTRGAALAVSRVDMDERVVTHAAVGNISGRVIGTAAVRSRSLVSQPGIVGHKLPRVQETRYDLADAQLVVLHSDGLTQKWDDASLPSVVRHGAAVCAAALLRDAGTPRDDASVLAVQVTG